MFRKILKREGAGGSPRKGSGQAMPAPKPNRLVQRLVGDGMGPGPFGLFGDHRIRAAAQQAVIACTADQTVRPGAAIEGISPAAALVEVRQRMRRGSTRASKSRATRSVRTRVFPEPALAETQTD